MLSQTLKELRTKKGVTQDDMAELLNIKRQTYSAYERGISTPDIAALNKIAEYFNVTVGYLVEQENTSLATPQIVKDISLFKNSYIKCFADKRKDLMKHITLVASMSENDMNKVFEYAEMLNLYETNKETKGGAEQ